MADARCQMAEEGAEREAGGVEREEEGAEREEAAVEVVAEGGETPEKAPNEANLVSMQSLEGQDVESESRGLAKRERSQSETGQRAGDGVENGGVETMIAAGTEPEPAGRTTRNRLTGPSRDGSRDGGRHFPGAENGSLAGE